MEITKLTIDKWAEEDRPREKLINFGAETLSNAELLAILIIILLMSAFVLDVHIGLIKVAFQFVWSS